MSVDNPLEQQSMRSTDQASTESSAINKLRRLSDGDYKRIVPSCLAVNYSWAAINQALRPLAPPGANPHPLSLAKLAGDFLQICGNYDLAALRPGEDRDGINL